MSPKLLRSLLQDRTGSSSVDERPIVSSDLNLVRLGLGSWISPRTIELLHHHVTEIVQLLCWESRIGCLLKFAATRRLIICRKWTYRGNQHKNVCQGALRMSQGEASSSWFSSAIIQTLQRAFTRCFRCLGSSDKKSINSSRDGPGGYCKAKFFADGIRASRRKPPHLS
jgi:hypothetical protein